MRLRGPLSLLALALLLAAIPATAHGRVCIQADGVNLDRGGHGTPGPTGATGDCPDGDLVEFVVGWVGEPIFVGEISGLDLGIRKPLDNAPIENVTTLSAQYEFGGKTFPLDLKPQFGRAGWYTDDISPTRAGEYTLRVSGTIITTAGVKQVNFTHHPGHVEPVSDIQFPEPTPDTAQLQSKVATLEQEVAALKAQVQAQQSRNGAVVRSPAPGTPGNGTPGFEPLILLGAALVIAFAARRRGAS